MHVDVGAGQQAFFPAGQPPFPVQGGAQGAAAVLAGVEVGRVDVAVGATPPVAAHGRGAAVAQRSGGVPLVGRQRVRRGERRVVLLQDGLHGGGHAAIGAH